MTINRSSKKGPNDFSQHDKEVVKTALQSGVTRREMLGWLTAAGASASSAGLLVSSISTAIAATATPKKGGSLRFAWDVHGPSDTLDPILFSSALDYARGRMTYNNLCRLNENLTAGAELAEHFEANASATEWIFQLRKGVEWHDGSKFNADDVVYSMMRHVGKNSKSKAKTLFGDVKEWTKIDDHTVRCTLNAPNAEIPVICGTFHFKIVKNGTNDFQSPVGTGPYLLKEFQPGIRSVHIRNDNYWNDQAGPYLDQIEAFGITDSVARVNALVAGDVQMIGNLDPKSAAQIESASGVETLSLASGTYQNINVRLDTSPGNNPDFVKGLKHLQHRERIITKVQKGRGSIGNDQPIGSAYGASWCKEVNDPPLHDYDPNKAKFLLNKSGITSAKLDVAEVSPGLMEMCLMLQIESRKIGFDLQINKVPNDGYWGSIWLKTPMHVGAWNMRPSANIMMTLAFKSDAPWNESGWKNERFDQLLQMSRAELDPTKRYEMNCEMQKLCAEESGILIPMHRAYLDAKATKVKGFPLVPLSSFGGMEWPEYIWLDS